MVSHHDKVIGKAIYLEKKMVSSFSCDRIVHQYLTSVIFCITELFAELVFSEKSGTQGDEVDLYEVVPQNDELQRVTFGQLKVFKTLMIIRKCCYEH